MPKGTILAAIGVACLVWTIRLYVVGFPCEGTWNTTPERTYKTQVDIKASPEMCESIAKEGADVGYAVIGFYDSACRSMEKCKNTFFSWRRVPLVGIIITWFFFHLALMRNSGEF